jgi:hypothetical protein
MSKKNIKEILKEQRTVEVINQEYLLKSHAIKFAEFVSNDIHFDDFWSMSEEAQEEIYKTFINKTQNQDE